MQCIKDPTCNINLKFNEKIPSEKNLSQCTVNKTKSCSVYLSVDFNNKQANIVFDDGSNQMKSPVQSFHDLFAFSPKASVIRRYIVQVQMHPQFKIHLHILMQCDTGDHCSISSLRHYWYRFTSIEERLNSSNNLFKILHSNSTEVTRCFNDETNQLENCSITSDACWALTNETRKCILIVENHTSDFIYAFNHVDYGYGLTDQSVFYKLICHKNDCNNNETIQKLTDYAREFADYTISAKYPTYKNNSMANRLSDTFCRIFSIGLFLVLTFFYYFK